jgi:RNA polymerase sigma-70 factor (ECF subfamily)
MFSTLDDSILVNQYILGDEKSLEFLLKKHKRVIFKTIISKVKSTELAEDLFQDTFIKIIHTLKLGKYNEEGKFLPWALRIANNLIIDYFRKNKSKKMISESSSNSDSFNVFTHMECGTTNWLQKTMQSELYYQLTEGVQFLPELQKELIEMRIFQGMSFKDIAEEKGISINTALGRMRYAVQNLRKILEQNQVLIEVE